MGTDRKLSFGGEQIIDSLYFSKTSTIQNFLHFFLALYIKIPLHPKETPNSFSRRVVAWSSWVTYQTLKSICQTRHRRDTLGHPKRSSCRRRQVEVRLSRKNYATGTAVTVESSHKSLDLLFKMSFPEQEKGLSTLSEKTVLGMCCTLDDLVGSH